MNSWAPSPVLGRIRNTAVVLPARAVALSLHYGGIQHGH